jgi:hypothetical protein
MKMFTKALSVLSVGGALFLAANDDYYYGGRPVYYGNGPIYYGGDPYYGGYDYGSSVPTFRGHPLAGW